MDRPREKYGMGDISSRRTPGAETHPSEPKTRKKFDIFDIDEYYSMKLHIRSAHDFRVVRYLLVLLELSCHGIPWFVGVAYQILRSDDLARFQFFANLFLVLVVDIAVAAVVKMVVRRKRPVYNRDDMMGTVSSVDMFSFPSGHATRAASVTYFLTQFAMLSKGQNLSIWIWSAVVSVSRIVLGRHYVSDVIFGYIIGLLQFKYIVLPLWISEGTCSLLQAIIFNHLPFHKVF